MAKAEKCKECGAVSKAPYYVVQYNINDEWESKIVATFDSIRLAEMCALTLNKISNEFEDVYSYVVRLNYHRPEAPPHNPGGIDYVINGKTKKITWGRKNASRGE